MLYSSFSADGGFWYFVFLITALKAQTY